MIVLFASAAVLFCRPSGLRAQDEAALPDNFGRAKRAFEAGQYLIARQYFKEFVTSNIGDRRKDEGTKLLAETYTRHAAALAKAGFPLEAAAQWLEYAEHLGSAAEAAAAKKSAADLFQGAFDAAMKAKDHDLAVQVAVAQAKQLSDATPLATPEKLKDLRLEALVAAPQKRMPIDVIYARLEEALKEGVTEQALSARKVNLHSIRYAHAQGLLQQGQFARAIELLSEWSTGDAPAAEKTKYEGLLAKALIERAELYAAFGNVAMLEKAVNAAASNPATKSSASRISALKKKLDQVKSRAAPTKQVLKIDAPLSGPATWQDDGAGNTIDGKLGFKKAKVAVAPGFVLDGGTMLLEEGTEVELHGTADRPVIFRNVKVQVTLGTAFKARFALFENCTFSKAGGWFATYSSKWVFSDCMLLRSNWSGLTEVDYGVQATGCAFVECKMHPRHLGGERVTEKASKYRDQWNKFEDDAFINCEVAPSFVWATKRCYFENCALTGEAWDNFRSTTDLDVAMSIPPGSERFFDAIRAGTQTELNGVVRYNKTQAARRLSVPLWRFAQAGE
jgi:hypothetical protein